MARRHEPELPPAAPSPRDDRSGAGRLSGRQAGPDPAHLRGGIDRPGAHRGAAGRARPAALRGGAAAHVSLAERLTRLSDVLVALSGSPIPTHLFQTLADLAPAAVACDYLAVCLPTPEQAGYLVHSLGPLPADISARIWKPDEGIPGRTMRTGQPIVVADLLAASQASPLEDILAGATLRAVLAV